MQMTKRLQCAWLLTACPPSLPSANQFAQQHPLLVDDTEAGLGHGHGHGHARELGDLDEALLSRYVPSVVPVLAQPHPRALARTTVQAKLYLIFSPTDGGSEYLQEKRFISGCRAPAVFGPQPAP